MVRKLYKNLFLQTQKFDENVQEWNKQVVYTEM